MATVAEPNASNANFRRAELIELRSKYLKHDRILGPAWLIMLRLLSRMSSRRSTEVCDMIAIPNISATTAQRCLEYLLAMGIVQLAPGTGKRFRSVQFGARTHACLRELLAAIDDADDTEQGYLEAASLNGEIT